MGPQLVVDQLGDAAHVALVAAEGLGDEGVDDFQPLAEVVHAPAQGYDVGIVVLPGQSGGLDGPGQGGAHAVDLIGGDLLAVAAAPQDNAETAGVVDPQETQKEG